MLILVSNNVIENLSTFNEAKWTNKVCGGMISSSSSLIRGLVRVPLGIPPNVDLPAQIQI